MASAKRATPPTTQTGPKLKVLHVSLDNRPGMLAQAARVLADHGVDLEAVQAEVLGKHGFFRFYTREPFKAEAALRAQGFIVTGADAIEVILHDRPGELARVAEALAAGGVNIESCFGSASGPGQDCRFFLRTSDLEKAWTLLQSAKVSASRLAR